MHVGCDAAECHHHILGYLKIDLPAFVCVCALLLRTGPALVYCPFLHALISLSRRGFSHAVVQYKKWSWCGICELDTCALSLSLSLSDALCHTHMQARTHARTDLRSHPHRGGYAIGHILQMHTILVLMHA